MDFKQILILKFALLLFVILGPEQNFLSSWGAKCDPIFFNKLVPMDQEIPWVEMPLY